MATKKRRRQAPVHIRAKAHRIRRERIKAREGADAARISLAERYADNPLGYIKEKLDWTPWSGTDEKPGQVQVIEAYILAIRQQLERRDYRLGLITEDDLRYWRPGQVIQNHIRVEAGHTVGKTKLASGIVNHFYDCYSPSIGYTFAPSSDQVNKLLWKEIRVDRSSAGLPGKVLDGKPYMSRSANHFVMGKATNDAHGSGTENVQGQHEEFLIFLLDEAEGIRDYVYDAVNSMTSGGIVIVIMLANPKTRLSRFHKMKSQPKVRSFRISCLHHPNVIQGKDVIPKGVTRDWVEAMIDEHAEVVDAHNEDDVTFEVPYPVHHEHGVYPAGTIYQPEPEFMFRVLGMAPKNLADNTFVPVGRYESAKARNPTSDRPYAARLGVDVSRYGADYGTLYVRFNGRAWRAARFAKKDTNAYARKIREIAFWLRDQGVTDLQVRVDGGGGFGGGVVDRIKNDVELVEAFERYAVQEVHFNGVPHDRTAYKDLATEMYAESAETLKGLAVHDPPTSLEADLCERTFEWVNYRGKDVKRLLPKEKFKKDHGRSPDDGDGFVLAVAPDFLFEHQGLEDYGNLSHSTL